MLTPAFGLWGAPGLVLNRGLGKAGMRPSSMRRLSLSLALLALATPATAKWTVAARGNEYYVAHKVQDRICAVFKKKPQGSWVIVGSYKSLREAATVMKSAADCRSKG